MDRGKISILGLIVGIGTAIFLNQDSSKMFEGTYMQSPPAWQMQDCIAYVGQNETPPCPEDTSAYNYYLEVPPYQSDLSSFSYPAAPYYSYTPYSRWCYPPYWHYYQWYYYPYRGGWRYHGHHYYPYHHHRAPLRRGHAFRHSSGHFSHGGHRGGARR